MTVPFSNNQIGFLLSIKMTNEDVMYTNYYNFILRNKLNSD